MWERFKRWLYIEYYWWKRKRGRAKARSRSSGRGAGGPVSAVIVMGTVVVFSVLLSRVIASVYRSFIPFVSGPQIADAYWASIAAALKLSLVFIGIAGVSIFLLVMRFLKRGNRK